METNGRPTGSAYQRGIKRPMKIKRKYAILGGGITGLIASHYIGNDDCMIIEQEAVLGGATTRPSSLGGVRILPDSSEIRELLVELKLPIYECNYTIGVMWEGNIYNLLQAARSFELITMLNDYCRKTRKQSYFDIPEDEQKSVMSGVQEKVHKYEEKIPYIGGIEYFVNQLMDEARPKTFFEKEAMSIKDKAIYLADGSIIEFDYLISTIPLVVLMDLMGTEVNLNFNTIRFLNVKLPEPKVISIGTNGFFPLYIYFPSLSVPFHRMSFPHRYVAHGGSLSSILIETTETVDDNPRIWEFLHEMGFIDNENFIIDEYTQPIGHFHYSEGASKLVKELEDFDIYCVGRYGEWNHNSNISSSITRIKEVLNGIEVDNRPKSHA